MSESTSWLKRITGFGWMGSGASVALSLILCIPLLWLATLPSPQTGISGPALEFPGTANTALAVLRIFDDAHLIGKARVAVYWDFALILAYVCFFASLLRWVARGGSKDELLPLAMRGALWAGALDALEDVGILYLTAHFANPDETWFPIVALLTTLAALAKWTLLSAVAGYSLWELAKLFQRARGYGLTSKTANQGR
jgi:hypothetical protein